MKLQLDEIELRALLAEISKRDTQSLSLDDDLMVGLDIDSLAALRILAAVEKRYGLRFADDQLSELRTLRRLLEGVELAEPEEKSS
jgi:acyl carrier protein